MGPLHSYGWVPVLYNLSQIHMDLEVYMREHDDHRGLVAEAKASCHGDGASAGDGNPTMRSPEMT